MLTLVIWLVLTASNVETKLRQRGHVMCSAYGHSLIEAKFGKEKHLLCLKSFNIVSSSLMSPQPKLYIDNEVSEGQDNNTLSHITLVHGFPVEDPGAGSAEGYIGEDQHFYGVLHLRNRTLHADPYGRDSPDRIFGPFDENDLMGPRARRHSQIRRPPFSYNLGQSKHYPRVARSRICDLLLLADKAFYDFDANSSLTQVVRRMMHAVAQADIIFRNADFNGDGVSDNIGFSVKYILVLTSNETNRRVFGDIDDLQAVDGRSYLLQFSRLRRLSEVCLGVAFSGHAFLNRTLGLSFTSLGGGLGGAAGGLCDHRAYGSSFNTLAIAHATTEDDQRVPERIAALTLAHEMGHSFGAHHDDNFPDRDCRNYLMGSQSTALDSTKTFEFSRCSKQLIAATLGSMSYCLVDEDQPYCGNGIVEDGETCDCGLPSRCAYKDPCCTPRAGGALVLEDGALHKEGCSVSPSAACHPSQGLCCNSKCQQADLSKSGIDCHMQDVDCTGMNSSVGSECGLGGRCLPDRSCHAAECALLGLAECACSTRGTGGVIGEASMCGICCLIGDNLMHCVGAELAARYMLSRKIPVPFYWPGEVRRGPSVVIGLYEEGKHNRTVRLRAWPPGGACVALNTVGVCSSRGVCILTSMMPRSNVYPDVMNVKLTQHFQFRPKSSRSRGTRVLFGTLSLLFALVIS